MSNQIVRNAAITVGTLIATYFLLRFVGVFGHGAANVATDLSHKF